MSYLSGSGQRELVVVGAGSAGLYTAICAAREGAHVTLVSATELAGSSSYWAQGGLAAVLAADDSLESHLTDTLRAGRGTVRASAARVLVDSAPNAVQDLIKLGVSFDADRHGQLALGLEGGHSHRRIVHAGGAATGRRIVRELSAVAAENGWIEILEGRRVSSLLIADDGRCVGVLLDDGERVIARATVLATGGAAALWARTTNPSGAAGGGLLLGYQAGAKLADMEMMQFHPTAVYLPGHEADGLLVTEAVRGEGGRLLDAGGERFVEELAPRDEVSRAIHRRLVENHGACVFLDMREVNPALFPNIVSKLRSAGIDPETEPVPVSPAAHYMMGGVAVDLEARTSIPALYAVGECSCTGLHGANRLASNSLSECFVFGARAARAALGEPAVGSAAASDAAKGVAGREKHLGGAFPSQQPALTDASRQALWRLAGIERDPEGLTELLDDPYPLVPLIARSALTRTESRGAHQRLDHPITDPELDDRHVVLAIGREAAIEYWDRAEPTEGLLTPS